MRLKNSKLKPRAFTLIEMVVVITLIAIMAAVIVPEMKGTFDDALLRSSGRDLVNAFSLASSRAVGFDRNYRVQFDAQNGSYAVEQQIRDGVREDFVPLKDISGAEGKLDSRISVEIVSPEENSDENSEDATANRNLQNAVSFHPDGTADAAEIRLRDRGGFQLLLQLNPITARVHVSEPQHE